MYNLSKLKASLPKIDRYVSKVGDSLPQMSPIWRFMHLIWWLIIRLRFILLLDFAFNSHTCRFKLPGWWIVIKVIFQCFIQWFDPSLLPLFFEFYFTYYACPSSFPIFGFWWYFQIEHPMIMVYMQLCMVICGSNMCILDGRWNAPLKTITQNGHQLHLYTELRFRKSIQTPR